MLKRNEVIALQRSDFQNLWFSHKKQRFYPKIIVQFSSKCIGVFVSPCLKCVCNIIWICWKEIKLSHYKEVWTDRQTDGRTQVYLRDFLLMWLSFCIKCTCVKLKWHRSSVCTDKKTHRYPWDTWTVGHLTDT